LKLYRLRITIEKIILQLIFNFKFIFNFVFNILIFKTTRMKKIILRHQLQNILNTNFQKPPTSKTPLSSKNLQKKHKKIPAQHTLGQISNTSKN